MIIRGNTVGTTVLGADYAETNETHASFIRNKPDAAIGKAQQTADTAKAIAQAALPKAGGTMTGPLEVPEPVSDNHPATKVYVDSKRKTCTLVLSADGWEGEGPYTQSVEVEGMLQSDQPHYGVVYSDNQETRLAEKEAFSLVDDLDTADGSVTFTCFEDKPEVSLSIQVEVMR